MPRPITEEATRIAFGQHLKKLRNEASLAQDELASRAGINRNYVGQLERAESTVSLFTINRLAHGLGLKPHELVPDK